jgi:hypothetical protein
VVQEDLLGEAQGFDQVGSQEFQAVDFVESHLVCHVVAVAPCGDAMPGPRFQFLPAGEAYPIVFFYHHETERWRGVFHEGMIGDDVYGASRAFDIWGLGKSDEA